MFSTAVALARIPVIWSQRWALPQARPNKGPLGSTVADFLTGLDGGW